MLQSNNNLESVGLAVAWRILYSYLDAHPGQTIFHVGWSVIQFSVTTDHLKTGLQFFFGPPPVDQVDTLAPPARIETPPPVVEHIAIVSPIQDRQGNPAPLPAPIVQQSVFNPHGVPLSVLSTFSAVKGLGGATEYDIDYTHTPTGFDGKPWPTLVEVAGYTAEQSQATLTNMLLKYEDVTSVQGASVIRGSLDFFSPEEESLYYALKARGAVLPGDEITDEKK